MKKIPTFILLFLLSKSFLFGQLIINHLNTDITKLSEVEINHAKSVLHIAYSHTSHGRQVTAGMTGLINFANGGGKGLSLPSDIFSWNNGGTNGELDLHDYAMDGDVGYYPDWYNNTVSYLNNPDNSDVNVVMWSWCGQVDNKYAAGTLFSEYLEPMALLESTYPNVKFVYMTGHLDHLDDDNNKAANDSIRRHCLREGKILYDFADIESFNPDGTFFQYAHDNCDYYSSDGILQGNWASEWRASHTEDVDWFTCESAHSDALNANQKAYAAWAMFVALANNDTPPSIAFNSTSSNGLESVGSAELQVDLSAVSGLEVTVDYTLTGSASGNGTDYELANGTLTISEGDAGNTITIASIVDDLVAEGDETVIVSLSNPNNATLGTNKFHTYTIIDNDTPPSIAFNSTSSNGLESVGSAELQVDLSAVSGLEVTVDYTLTGSASGNGTDYELANGTLTISAGDAGNTITIASIVDDLLAESDETIIVSLSNPNNATLGTNTVHTYTITDNDAPPSIAFNTTSSNGLESVSSAELQVDLSAVSGIDLTVDYTLTGTASGSGTDFELANGTLTISAGDASNTITIANIVDDLLAESDETIIVSLSNPNNATLGTNTVHTYTITDNDAPPSIAFNSTSSNGLESVSSAELQVALSAVSELEVTVDYTLTGTASGSGTDYELANGTLTISAGDAANTITIASIVDDLVAEGDETVIVSLSNPNNATLGTNTVHTYTITDNDSSPSIAFNSTSSNGLESVSSAELQVDLSAVSGLEVTVDYTLTGSASGNGTDYELANGTLSISAGDAGKTITIASIVDDLLAEGDETIIVSLSNPNNATLGTNTVHTYTITDNDAPPSIAFNSTSSNGLESVSSAELLVDLSAASGLEVTVDYTVTGTASGSGTDYELANGTLSISAGDASNTITIASIVDDLLAESNETVIVSLSNPNNATLGTNTVHTYTITDNDSSPSIAFNSTSSNGLESVSSAELQVDLSAVSGLEVTVDYTLTGSASGNGTDYELANGTLTISEGDASNTITIASIVDDLVAEGDETVIVSLSNPNNATLGTNTAHAYTITDNDYATNVSDILKNNIFVYPNPFVNRIHLKGVSDDISHITIINIYGQKVLEADYKGESVINVGHLSSGMYLLTIENSINKKQVIKILKK